MNLRWYQEEAVQAIYSSLSNGSKAPLIVTPTGSGKSVILAEFIRRACTDYPGTQILVVTHVKELVEQDFNQIKRFWPSAPVGIYSAGLGQRRIAQVTVASIQSIFKRDIFHGRFDIVIVDEAHLIPHKSDGSYRKLLDSCYKNNPKTKLVGLTATPYRLDSGSLTEGSGAMFDSVAYEVSVTKLIEQGFLCPITSRHGDDVDLSGVKITAGEFNAGALGQKMSAIELVNHHADVICEKFLSRNSWLIFAVTVDHAARIRDALIKRGIPSDYVSGDHDAKMRDQKIADFKSGKLRALVNCAILTTGFDHPPIDAIAMLRPTMSPGLYLQQVGRGLRLHESKKNCLVLDFGGNVLRHGMIDMVRPPVKGEKKGNQAPPVKRCDQCGAHCPISLHTCECGFVFPVSERTNEVEAYSGAVVSTDVKPVVCDVDSVELVPWVKPGKTPTVRVIYYCGFIKVSEWVCPEHSGYSRQKFEKWWNARTDNQCRDGVTCPEKVEDVISSLDSLLHPKQISVLFAGKFPEIKSYIF